MFFTADEFEKGAEKLAKLANGELPPDLCPLCERHQRMETLDDLQFWIELTNDGKPLLCSDNGQRNGVHVLAVNHCPLCGRGLGVKEAEK